MNQRRLSIAVLLADLVWSALAMGAALALPYGMGRSPAGMSFAVGALPLLEVTWVSWAFFSALWPLDGFRGGWQLSAVVSQLLLAVGGLMLILWSYGYLIRSYVSPQLLLEFAPLLFAGFVALRVAFYLCLRVGAKSAWARRVVIVGSGGLVRELAGKIQKHPEMLRHVIGFLAQDNGTVDSHSSLTRLGQGGSSNALRVVDMLSELHVDELILALPGGLCSDLLAITRLCRDRGIRVSVVPQLYELYLSRSQLIDLDGLPILQLAKPGLSRVGRWGKRGLDLCLGSLLALVSVPLLLPLAVALHLRRGKAFRWEKRCGIGGKPFAMLRLNVERTGDCCSRFELVLRDLSLSELPQLWNVLRGQMSLVGPRPESWQRVCRYSEWQQQRLAVKPGITGLAQVQGLREQSSSEEKARFDLQYLLRCSPWTDLSLLLQTLWTLAARSRARANTRANLEGDEAPAEAVASEWNRRVLKNAYRA